MEFISRRHFLSSLLLVFIFFTYFRSCSSKHRIRHYKDRFKRQYGASQSHPEPFVTSDGAGPDGGPWSPWSTPGPCSRSCGGGVSTQIRQCQWGSGCQGPAKKHVSCNVQDCPDLADFRAQQCAEFDSVSLDGIFYQWIPYTKGPNPCELMCMPKSENYYHRLKEKVVDGTLCNDESLDVCVDGQCQPVGCDRMLGSTMKEDLCRNCGGDGSMCQTVNDNVMTQDFQFGYNDIIVIPEGATNILVKELAPSNNYLAVRNATGHYYLNGYWRIDFPRTLDFSGCRFHYERYPKGFSAPDSLKCWGPIDETLFIVLLAQDDNVGVHYEYSIPTNIHPWDDTESYAWSVEEFSPCNATCGGGVQTRNVTCVGRKTLQPVDNSLCNKNSEPASTQPCSGQPCEPQWAVKPWGNCSVACGDNGTQTRQVYCGQIIANGVASIVDDERCQNSEKPHTKQPCNQGLICASWYIEPWKPCDHLCGEGKQTRKIRCFKEINGKKEVLDDSECIAQQPKPETEKKCDLRPCEGVAWITSEWSGCEDKCGLANESRKAQCATPSGEVYSKDLCSEIPLPELVRPCNTTNITCESQWYAGQWSECSAKCGSGVQTRRVFCGIPNDDGFAKVEESKCDPKKKYEGMKNCTGEKEECEGEWFSGPWSKCSKPCGGGERTRKVVCLSDDVAVPSTECDPNTIAFSLESCNTHSCGEDQFISSPSYPRTTYDNVTMFEETEGSSLDTVTPETSTPVPDEDEYEEVFDDECEDGVWVDVDEEPTDSSDLLKTTPVFKSTILESAMTSETDLLSSILPESSISEGTMTSGKVTSESTLLTDELMLSDDTSPYTDKEWRTTDMFSADTGSGDTEIASGLTTIEGSGDFSTDEIGTTVSGPSKATDTTEDVSQSGATDLSTDSSGMTQTESSDLGSSVSGLSASSDLVSATDSSDITAKSTDISGATSSNDVSTSDSTDSSQTTLDPTSPTSDTTVSDSSPTSDTTPSYTSENPLTSDLTTGGLFTTTSDLSSDVTGETTLRPPFSIPFVGESDVGAEVVDDSKSSGSTDYSVTDSSAVSEISGSTTSEFSSEGVTQISGSTQELTSGATELSTEMSTETGSTDTSATGISTISGQTEETSSSIFGSSTEYTSGYTESTESPAYSTTSSDLSSSEMPTGSTVSDLWETTSITELFMPKKLRKCRRKKRIDCKKTKYGCCIDKVTPAKGPFDKGCPLTPTCNETQFGCCEDGVSVALGKRFEGCPASLCNETLFGCCPDNRTAAEGNNNEGCPPECLRSKFGCCKDNITKAKGPNGKGCEEFIVTTVEPTTEQEDCSITTYGCCPDGKTSATGADYEGCDIFKEKCTESYFGCCPDGATSARGPNYKGCKMPCEDNQYGCCEDGVTPAHGPNREGCCLITSYGCCPDNIRPAQGPNLEGCGCQYSPYRCCPDNVTAARGYNNEGCGCQYTKHGCCPDNHTPAAGPDYKGCECQTFQFGCCPDGITVAEGAHQLGCGCKNTEFGCCSDEVTPAEGPNQSGCGCESSKYGCCLDGVTEAKGENFEECEEVPVNLQVSCERTPEPGPCDNYTVKWFFSMAYGGCSRFWYGGCSGNPNRFKSQEECLDVCVKPEGRAKCSLPKVEGGCNGYYPRWYYDNEQKTCAQFIYSGCLGNNNRFETRAECMELCSTEIDICDQSIEEGPCHGNFIRWYFDKSSGQCSQFIYGGCKGNGNNFLSEAACKQKCTQPGLKKDQCYLPKEQGNCTEQYPRWYHNTGEQRCMPFYYTGCNGNTNNYVSQEACEAECPKQIVKGTCQLPAEVGECSTYTERWYYDTKEKNCLRFYYGGCGGNGNNFATDQDCLQRCDVSVPQPGPFKKEHCFLTSDTGPCRDYSARWYYDTNDGVCKPFTYGGCKGNENNFQNAEECQQQCGESQDICTLPAVAGPCNQTTEKWYYNSRTQACQKFAYGGCLGNNNKFEDKTTCEQQCKYRAPVVTQAPLPGKDACNLPYETGPCSQVLVKYYYDSALRSCNPFYYGGCYGNENRFETLQDCEYVCASTQPTQPPPPRNETNFCQLLPEVGECKAYVPRWYYDNHDKKCAQFYYGGCGGNKNNFESSEDCEESCGEPATLKPIYTKPSEDGKAMCLVEHTVGDCTDYTLRWYYDIDEKTCLQFYYGGCNGNGNNFETQEACEDQCRDVIPAPTAPPSIPAGDDICHSPSEIGDCSDYSERWYYDDRENTCLQFYYGGCGGNKNNFESKEACEQQCSAAQPAPFETELCFLSSDGGPCHRYTARWHYDRTDGACKQFVYGGCQGNRNNFLSASECEEKCENAQNVCTLPVVVGPCNQTETKWYYNPRTDSCEEFNYGGCLGNNNRFDDKASCESQCKQQVPEVPVTYAPPVEGKSDDIRCYARPDAGNCFESVRSYYYDITTEQCLFFAYSGCGGNANRFSSIRECVRECGNLDLQEICNLPSEQGPCTDLSIKYYYDRDNALCSQFYYGGCGGNNNRFASREECQYVCGRQTEVKPATPAPNPSETCRLPVDMGLEHCKGGYFKHYYFDDTRGECVPFIYSGCGGNSNNFETFEACLDFCKEFLAEPPNVNCQKYVEECSTMYCKYGTKMYVDEVTLCTRCRCHDPCVEIDCERGYQCTVDLNQNRVNYDDPTFIGVCRPEHKEGECPHSYNYNCDRECETDADCSASLKCCFNGCGTACVPPAAHAPAPLVTTPYQPAYTEGPKTYYPPTVDEQRFQPTVTGGEGDYATLDCAVHGNPTPSITWKKGSLLIDGTQPRYRLLLDGTLQVITLHKTDSGIYLCAANNGIGHPIEKAIKLDVTDSDPHSTSILGDDANSQVVAVLGGPTTLQCYATGFPFPLVTWWKDDSMIPLRTNQFEIRKDYSLHINSVQLSDLGIYTCQAYNGIGKAASWSVTVQALGPVYSNRPEDTKFMQFVINPSDRSTIKPFYPESIPSHVLPGPEPEPPFDPNEILPEPHAEGNVVFQVPVKANITEIQNRYQSGSDISIGCDVDGYPIPQVQWYKNEIPLYPSDNIQISESHRLYIRNAKESDSGIYRCEAVNEYSRSTSSITIEVEALNIHPNCTDNPLFANCELIVRAQYCVHKYYAKFCCKSCTEAGQLPFNWPHAEMGDDRQGALSNNLVKRK